MHGRNYGGFFNPGYQKYRNHTQNNGSFFFRDMSWNTLNVNMDLNIAIIPWNTVVKPDDLG